MSRADRLNELRRVHRQRTRQTRTWVSSGEGTDEVAAPLAGPPGRGAQPPVAQALPVGETLTVLGDPQTADGGGTPLVVSRRAPGIRGGGQTDFEMPASRFEPGTFAYYTVTVSFDWQSWTGGGWVAVERSGVELERCRAEFGVRFEHTFHVGVIDPAGEEYVEVLASPAGDPMADGFDETPDGQTLRNLRITWELVDVPRVPVEPSAIVPWAWYRADDLQGPDGGDATALDDRADGQRHLAAPGPDYHAVARGTLDGRDAIRGRSTPGASAALEAQFADYTFSQGVTIVQVGGLFSYRTAILGSQITAGVELYNDGQYLYVTSAGWHGGAATVVPEDERDPMAVVVQLGPDVVRMWRAGDEVSSWDYHSVASPADWENDPLEAGWVTIHPTDIAETILVGEYVVFDGLVDPDADPVDFGADGVQTLHGYLAGRYPSLFGGG